LAEVEIVFYVFYFKLFGTFFVVQSQVCQAPEVVVKRT
jgi:hypothetical protein